MTDTQDSEPRTQDSAQPRRWPRLYAAVLGALGLEIVLFYLLTRAFS